MKKILKYVVLSLILVLVACDGGSNLTEEQQANWDLIEDRLETGYDSWFELWEWTGDVGISWGPRVDGQRPDQEVIDLTHEYGLVYQYVDSEPGFGDEAFGNEDEIILISHFEYYTYNEAVREMAAIDVTDGEGLTEWLENGGQERLEATFNQVQIVTGNFDTDAIIEITDPEDWEFVEWFFINTGVVSFEDSQIFIGRYYQEVIPTIEEAQAALLEAIATQDKTVFISDFGTSTNPTTRQLTEWLNLEASLIEIADIAEITLRHENSDEENLMGEELVNDVRLGSDVFENWEFTYQINEDGSITLEFLFIYDAEIYIPTPPEPVTLTTGEWFGGDDVPAGRWIITGTGSGNFVIWRNTNLRVNEILGGGTFGVVSVTTDIAEGDEITISGLSNVTFTPVTERTLSNSLSAGHWIVGQDIEAGAFDASAPSGSGNFVIWRGNSLRTNEILGDGSFGVESVRVNLADGDRINISGLDRVDFE